MSRTFSTVKPSGDDPFVDCRHVRAPRRRMIDDLESYGRGRGSPMQFVLSVPASGPFRTA